MVVFPNAKINFGLNILSKREDGFHNIESVFYPVPWKDILEVIPASETSIKLSGIFIDGQPEDNLCFRLFKHLQQKFNLPNVKIHLHKNIPVGAGLGGGSSDAAFFVKLINEKFLLGLSDDELEEVVRPFGSDCAFFIRNIPVYAKEKGDRFESISPFLKGKYIVMIFPDLAISTKEAYSGITVKENKDPLKKILDANPNEWKNRLKNDFEEKLLVNYPILSNIKLALYNMGAIYASMSGSGSTMYGIFDKEISVSGTFPPIYDIMKGWL